MAAQLLPAALAPGMLLTADRGFFSYALWRTAVGTGADLLWRIRTDKTGPKPQHLKDLPDGTWLAQLQQRHSAAARNAPPMLVRVIAYTLDPTPDASHEADHSADQGEDPTIYRLFTTLLDPVAAPAVDLGGILNRDGLKPARRGSRSVTLELFSGDATGNVLDVGLGQDSRALLHGLAQQAPDQGGGRDAFAVGSLTQPLVEVPVDAQVHGYVQRVRLLAGLGFGGLGFFRGDLSADRLVPYAALRAGGVRGLSHQRFPFLRGSGVGQRRGSSTRSPRRSPPGR